MDHDLYVYLPCGTLVASSVNGTGATDQVTVTSTENIFADISFGYGVDVRYFGGSSCSSSTVTFDGRGGC